MHETKIVVRASPKRACRRLERRLRPLRLSFSLALLSWISACQQQHDPELYPVEIRTYDEHGDPLAQVALSADGNPLGHTDESGTLDVALTGREGKTVVLSAQCPEGYRNNLQDRRLKLRRFSRLDDTRAVPAVQRIASAVLVSWQCLPKKRLAALVVRASGQQDMPVVIDAVRTPVDTGRNPTGAMARTGPQGTAHILLELPPRSEFRATLDTSARPDLRPVSPVRSFPLEDEDTIFVFDQKFEHSPRPKKPRRRRPKPRRHIPYRIM